MTNEQPVHIQLKNMAAVIEAERMNLEVTRKAASMVPTNGAEEAQVHLAGLEVTFMRLRVKELEKSYEARKSEHGVY